MDIWAAQLFTGVSLASILLLVALGLTFTFGQMNVVNMAHGEFIMAGAYTAYVLQRALGAQFRERGLSMLLAEQYFDFAMRLADRYVVLDAGKVVAQGDTGSLADNTAVRELIAF